MPLQPSNDHLKPRSFTLPTYTTTQRDLMIVQEGTEIFNSTTKKINVCVVENTAGAGSWEAVTSA